MNRIVYFFSIFLIFINPKAVMTKNNSLYYSIHGKGIPVITIHGGPGMSSAYFKPYLNKLSENNKLVYYDQSGCGLSIKPYNYKATFKGYINDIENLREKINAEKIVLLAHSFGVVIALKYYLRYPSRIKKLILVSGFGRKHPEQYKYFMVPENIMSKIRGIINSRKPDKYKREQINIYRTIVYFHKKSFRNYKFVSRFLSTTTFNKKVFSNLVYSNEYRKFDARFKIKSLNNSVPVLIIVGKHDIVTPPFLSEEIAACFKNPKYSLFENSGHFPFVEENHKFLSVVNNFLKKD